jgi:hypothetical protein
VSALRKLEWAKDTPRWVKTNILSKSPLKGSLVVVVILKFIATDGIVFANNQNKGSQTAL